MDHLTDREFDRACTYLARSFGLDMRSKRVLLECRLSRERERLGMPSFSAYLDLMESGANPAARARFIDLVTTHYTYFLRESRQFDFLRTVALPELERARPRRTWNILCAGCSTGEECYTVSMLVEDYARGRDIPPVRITGIDVSEPALAEARRAVYPASRIEKVPPRWLSSYFVREGKDYAVAEPVRRRVAFAYANLSDAAPLARTYDLILCRNVIIYFEDRTRERVLDTLHRHLALSSYLVLGHAEIVRDRALFAYRGNSIYQKLPEATLP
ncbi:CheR family methyltransferase [Arabiibacter massiliensis]|uniref:CheR family methyltransferase n=1 Tax=Arabiibacter massiliensis TaxID=1870985 RepID=UPI0009BB3DC6|nr:protein-glutamate O-methyltransferase CheR [Arabiibacter massiliensis]